MEEAGKETIDVRIRDAFASWKKLDEMDVKILEGLSFLGPRNLASIAEHLRTPTSTVRYRVKRMLEDRILFLHINPYHTHMGLKKALVFIEAEPGYEDVLLDCARVNDFWLFLCRIYGPYEGCGGIWTVPRGRDDDFISFLQSLIELGVARSYDVNWTTCHEGIPVKARWYDTVENEWAFNWSEWMEEVGSIEGELPWTLVEPRDWPIMVDQDDLLIIKELEIDGRRSLTDVSKRLGIPFERVKYHFREHVSKRKLIEGYNVEIYRFPFLFTEYLFFKFEFNSHEQLTRFALSLRDKPFPFHIGKVIGENALTTHIYLPKWEFRRFISALSKLIRRGFLRDYHYVIQDMYQSWRETIPYQHFNDGRWNYDGDKLQEKIGRILEENGLGSR
ncbi:MAG: Lrp/AsnC family transcriptional regulator [Candidatus Bathyarchaeota archaeon]|nr:Lrp/AsnC family transcriptional regulator [Candidatus Bathyarchaeota archaeon]